MSLTITIVVLYEKYPVEIAIEVTQREKMPYLSGPLPDIMVVSDDLVIARGLPTAGHGRLGQHYYQFRKEFFLFSTTRSEKKYV